MKLLTICNLAFSEVSCARKSSCYDAPLWPLHLKATSKENKERVIQSCVISFFWIHHFFGKTVVFACHKGKGTWITGWCCWIACPRVFMTPGQKMVVFFTETLMFSGTETRGAWADSAVNWDCFVDAVLVGNIFLQNSGNKTKMAQVRWQWILRQKKLKIGNNI